MSNDAQTYMDKIRQATQMRSYEIAGFGKTDDTTIPFFRANSGWSLVMFNQGLMLDVENATNDDYAKYPLLETDSVLTDEGSKPVMLRRPAEGECCVIDWLSITMRLEVFTDYTTKADNEELRNDAIVKNFSSVLREVIGFGVSYRNDFGRNFYRASYSLEHNAGLVCIGGQNDTIMLMLNGIGCTYASDDWQAKLHWWLVVNAPDAKITRIDLAHDDLYGDYLSVDWFNDQDDKGGFTNGIRRSTVEQRGSWKRITGKGRSLYIGSRTSSKFCRIYEKGKQLGDKNSNWVRCEVEYKSKDLFIPLNVLISPSQFFLASYPCFHVFDSKVKPQDFERIQTQEKITYVDSLALVKKQYGRYLLAFRQTFNDDAFLLDYLTDITNKSYPDRLDFLTIPHTYPKQT